MEPILSLLVSLDCCGPFGRRSILRNTTHFRPGVGRLRGVSLWDGGQPGADGAVNIFISYARADGAELAQKLHVRLEAGQHDAFLDTSRTQGGEEWSRKLEEAIDGCDVLLAVISPGSYDSTYCRAEVFRAFRKGKRVIPLHAQPNSDWPLILEAAHYLDFTGDFETRYRELLPMLAGSGSARLRPEFAATRTIEPFGAPPVLDARLKIDRSEMVDKLRNALLAEHNRTVALTAVAGQGGLGKTVLAAFLFRDEVVRQAFPGGIVWVPIGRERKLDALALYQEILRGMGDDPGRYANELAAKNRYAQLLRERPALVIFDDIWTTTDLDPFLTDSPRSRIVFTTRNAAIARHFNADLHQVDRLSEEEAIQMLARAAEYDPARLPLAAARDLVRECGYLPKALAQIGRMLVRGTPADWGDTLELMRNADRAAIEALLPEGDASYFVATEVSINTLAEPLQKKYKALAVLLEDHPAPLEVLETLWAVKPVEARRTARILAERSLADFAEGVLRLHDLQFDYIRALHKDQVSLGLIHQALRLSAHVWEKDASQFASQWTGRLLPYRDRPTIAEFLDGLEQYAPRPWLRPVWPSLDPPGTALLRTLTGHSRVVRGVAVSADGRRAVSASDDKTLKVWDVESGREIHSLSGHSSVVSGVAVSADGRRPSLPLPTKR